MNNKLNDPKFYDKREAPGYKQNCPHCGNEKKVYIYTNLLSGKSQAIVDECECETKIRLEQEAKASQLAKIEFSEKCEKFFPFNAIDPDIKEHIFENFEVNAQNKAAYNEARKVCFSFWGKYGINLVGSYGSGKTRLIKTILNERRLKGEDAVFVEYARIFDRIFASYEKGSSESKKDLMDVLTRVKNLGIDELGVGSNTAAKEDLFLNILNERKRRGLVTHFTMNPEGESNLGGRIKSRINEFAMPIPNNAPDYRLKALKAKVAETKAAGSGAASA